MTDFLETRTGEYWVATYAGLVRFNPKAPPQRAVVYANKNYSRAEPMFTVIAPDEGRRYAITVTVVYEDHTGAIWCGSHAGLFRLEREEDNLALRPVDIGIPHDPGEGWTISDLLGDRNGSLWVAAAGALYRRWPNGSAARYTKREGLPDDYLHDLLEDHQGRMWAGTRYGGFFQFAVDDTRRPPVILQAFSTPEGMPTAWVFQLFEGSDGKFWVATAQGLLQFFPNRDDQGRWFHSYGERNGLSDDEILSLNEDLGGNLWLGAGSAGAMKLERNGFISYGQRDGLYSVKSIFEDRAGGLCFRGNVLVNQRNLEGWNSDEPGSAPDYRFIRLGRFDGRTLTWFTPDAVGDLGWIMEGVTLQTRNGEWWVGGAGGLYRFPAADSFDRIKTARPLTVYNNKNGLGKDYPARLFEDSHSNVWIGVMSDKPLLLWERDNQALRVLSTAPGFPTDGSGPHSFGEDHAGNIWIGFDGRIARYRNGVFRLFTTDDGVPPGIIVSIYVDHAGRLWLASARSGLIRVDDPSEPQPKFVSYTTEQGLSSNSTEASAEQLIVEDLLGRIYIGTGRGLDRLDPSTGHFKHFTTADGLAPGAFRACFRDSHGVLWFGMTRGLSRFAPAPDESDQTPPSILISDVRVAGSRQFISALDETEFHLPDLAADQNQLQIDFIGLSFTTGDVLRYQYKVEGAGEDWSAPTEQRSVTYRFASGRYSFLVRAVNSDGVVSSIPAIVTFRILPPFWLRWWFLTLVAIGLTFLLYALYRYRVAQLVELERVRTRIATDLHDDIGSSLSRMAILSEVAKRKVEGAASESVSLLSEIAESARGTVDSMGDIVWAIDPRRDDLSNVVFRVRQFASDLLGTKGVSWQFQAPAEFDKIKLSPQQRRQLFLIFKEAINNAARHADCNSVCLSLSIVRNQIIAEIQDDGCGFEIASSWHAGNGGGGHGLENIKSRAVQLGGHLTINSSPGKGTNIRVEAPLKKGMA